MVLTNWEWRKLRCFGVRLFAVFGALLAMLPLAGEAEVPIVKIDTVTATGAGLKRVFFGQVVARETVDLAFQVGGQIVDFPLEEGARVAAGGKVARLDQEPFQLALNEARARHDMAKRTLNRYRQLEGSSVSHTNVQDAETDVELAGIALRNAERAMEQATLNAPFDALVASRLVPNFSTISAGTPVVRLHDMSDLRIKINVPETLFQQAGRDPKLEIFAEFPTNPERYPVELREFKAETASVGQTYAITLGMTPPDDLLALPGSSAKVTATLLTGDTRIEVPVSAIVTENDGSTFVMVFTPAGADEGIVTKTPVRIAATERGTVAVVDGLDAGQDLVVVGGAALDDGAAVRRFTGFSN